MKRQLTEEQKKNRQSDRKGGCMNTIFQTFKHNGRQFLAIPNGNGEVTVIDELGYNYGAYFDLESFEKYRKRNDAVALCVCRIAVTERAAIPAEMPKEVCQHQSTRADQGAIVCNVCGETLAEYPEEESIC